MNNPPIEFPNGSTVRVRRYRCQEVRGEFLRTPEEYDGVVVRTGPTGMVYVRRPSGMPGVIHPEDCTLR